MRNLRDANVLVVDDEPDLRDMVAFEFELMGSRVFSAENGFGAYGIVESERIDAVITDLRMAGCDGLSLLGKIRTRNPREPVVVFITAYESDLPVWEAYGLGAEAVFPKPFSLKALVDNVQRALTPPEERWSVPPGETPSLMIEQELPDLEMARKARLLELGQGGLAFCWPKQRSLLDDRVQFCLRLAGGPIPLIEGVGVIRWVHDGTGATAPTCGIEFEYLTDACRPTYVAWLQNTPCVSYIPRL